MAATDETPPLQGRHILVVEDEMLIAMEIEALLRRLGCTVMGPLADTRRALAQLEKEKPDAALLDLNLNGKPATPIAAALAEQDVPFILVTGYSPAQSSDPLLSGAPRLTKPIHARTLERALTAMLPSA